MKNDTDDSNFDRELYSDVENVNADRKEHLQFSPTAKIIGCIIAAVIGFVPGIILLLIDIASRG